MAGEWIPVDCALPNKIEVVRLVRITNQPPDVVVGRLVLLWLFAQLHCADGTIDADAEILSDIAGGDPEFWAAVAHVGWIRLDGGTTQIVGWDERFSKAAKRRGLDAIRKKTERAVSARRPQTVRSESALRPHGVRMASAKRPQPSGQEKKREDEIREEITHTPAADDFWEPFDRGESEPGWAATAWADFANRWNATERANPWRQLTAPDGWVDYAGRPGWLERANDAMARLPGCKFFSEPVAVTRFFDYVDRILAGEFDHEKSTGRPRRENRGVRL